MKQLNFFRMNKLCRFCLSVPSEKEMVLSEECDILRKMKECLFIEIILNKSLPSQICSDCVDKIEDIYNYHKKVKANQEVLLKHIIDNEFETDKQYDNNFECKIEMNIPDNENDASRPFEIESIKETYSSSDDELLSSSKIDDQEEHRNKLNSQLIKRRKKDILEKNKHTSENLPHKCLMCLIECRSQSDLVQHYNEHEQNKTKHIKKSDCVTIKEYKINTLEDGVIVYECCICCKSYNKNPDILKHIASHNRPFICKLCGRTYKTVYEIVRHGRAHNGEVYHCSFGCGFSTVYKGALRNHERRHGSPEFKFTCEKCGKGFHVKTWHDQHQNVHSGLKPFVCDICGIAFHMDRYLTAHRSKMHPQASLIKKHICVICSLPCDTRNSLKRHMEEHGVKSILLCDLCGKVFTNSELLKYHMNSHLGVKPYTCSMCNKKFAKKFNLKMHERTHAGERAHACTHCGKSFTQNSALRRHGRRYHAKLQDQENVMVDSIATK